PVPRYSPVRPSRDRGSRARVADPRCGAGALLLERAAMGLLDYYRQFEGLSEEEVNSELREEAGERRRKALARVPAPDLSQTTSPEPSHNRIVSAISYVARRGLNRYPHTRGTELRDELAARHEIDPQRVILGNGAAELLPAATRALLEPGQRLFPSLAFSSLYPTLARR